MGCRVVLRRMRAADEDEFVRLAEQSTGLHADWVRTPTDPPAFRDYLARFADPAAGEALLIKRADTGAIAGHVALTGIVRGPYDRAVLGFAAFVPSAGPQIHDGGRRAGRPLRLRATRPAQGLRRTSSRANEPSRRLVQLLGFRREGFSPELINIGASGATTNAGPSPPA